jgi:hypothetical protein
LCRRSKHEQRCVFEEQLCVRPAAEPTGSAGNVLPSGLDCAVCEVHVVVGCEMLTQHDRDLVGELLRV